MITAENVHVDFGATRALGGGDLTGPDEGTGGLVGPNGSGKSPRLRALYGSVTPSSGRVLLDGSDLHTARHRDVARAVAVVAQERDATSSGMPMSVADLVTLGRLPHQGRLPRTSDHDRAVVTGALDAVGMTDLARRDLAELSGGERQRALIARALAQQTRHILLDEPTNHLDVRYQH
ncbi:MAG: ABC transporter ATP-binding protein, partial [Corynebacterium sp.]|nr:ABC transporter ATP-binding protein [Corynebacterium sp.]